jgi:hypothetical protein
MRRKLKINLLLCALIANVLAFDGCTSLNGKVQNNLYISTDGNFSCPIPAIYNFGGKVHVSDDVDRKNGVVSAGTVHFSAWTGTYRIDYLAARHVPSQKDPLDWMLATQLEMYRKIPSPQAYVLYREFDKDGLFAVLVAPEGDLRTVNGYGKHLDLSRTMLIFKNGDFIYAISADDPDSDVDKSDDKSSARIDRLRSQIDEFARSIKFLTPTTTN